MYYSPSTNGFYIEEVHGTNMPDDVVELSDSMHTTLLEGQNEGKRILPGPDGRPILTDTPPASPEPVLTPEEKLAVLGLTKDDLKALLA
jgi:hypothetical protein